MTDDMVSIEELEPMLRTLVKPGELAAGRVSLSKLRDRHMALAGRAVHEGDVVVERSADDTMVTTAGRVYRKDDV